MILGSEAWPSNFGNTYINQKLYAVCRILVLYMKSVRARLYKFYLSVQIRKKGGERGEGWGGSESPKNVSGMWHHALDSGDCPSASVGIPFLTPSH